MDYVIRSLGKTCAATGRAFAPGERVVSVVLERNGTHERLDFAERDWKEPPPMTVGFWRCRVPDADVRSGAALDPEAMLAYFEQLAEDANPGHDQLRYVLALYLLQKRRLRLDGARVSDDGEYLQLSGSKGEGPYEIRDQQLADDQIKSLQSELTQALAA